MQVREAQPTEIPIIHALARKIWMAHYPSIISMEQIEYMLEKMYSKTALQQQLTEGHRFFILSDEKIDLGYLSFSQTEKGNYFLHKFYIDTQHHRKGLGHFFFDTVFNAIYDLKTIRLTVNRTNLKAINFYFKKGFTIEEVKDFDIGNNYFMNDFVMLYKK
ncbi:MAG: GNAT family N-acetyltransferase [Bacteroidetes bacterium]|nr:GNAT family N-acetyltransferase [Bacteroidota bacterium]